MFITWLYEQLDSGDDLAAFAKVVENDRNNGCMPPIRGVTDIKTHFKRDHPRNYTALEAKLHEAFIAYAQSLPPKTAGSAREYEHA